MEFQFNEADMEQGDLLATKENQPGYTGILLAAGKGRRFDPAGIRNKLLQRLPGGDMVVLQAARNLQAAVGRALVVVPAGSPLLVAQLSAQGLTVTECGDADTGMAASLMHGVRLASNASGWVIALGDMPFVRPETIRQLIAALAPGAGIAVPSYRGVRGNPVAFGRVHLAQLLQLSGDVGARSLLQRYPVVELALDDPGVCRDIDTVADLQNSWAKEAGAGI
jgi:molybdenum cofactor cytidylyltransferase